MQLFDIRSRSLAKYKIKTCCWFSTLAIFLTALWDRPTGLKIQAESAEWCWVYLMLLLHQNNPSAQSDQVNILLLSAESETSFTLAALTNFELNISLREPLASEFSKLYKKNHKKCKMKIRKLQCLLIQTVSVPVDRCHQHGLTLFLSSANFFCGDIILLQKIWKYSFLFKHTNKPQQKKNKRIDCHSLITAKLRLHSENMPG